MADITVGTTPPVTVSVGPRQGVGVSITAQVAGTTDYRALHHKPKVNGTELIGDRELPEDELSNLEILEILRS